MQSTSLLKMVNFKALIDQTKPFTDDTDHVELSIKPKLMIFALTTIFWGLGQFYYFSAMRAR